MYLYAYTLPTDKILSDKNARAWVNGFIFKKINEDYNIKTEKKSWEPFRSCLLNSTANLAQFG